MFYSHVGDRVNCSSTDFSAILPEEVEQEMKKACEISMGTEVSEIDIINIRYLCEQVSRQDKCIITPLCEFEFA